MRHMAEKRDAKNGLQQQAYGYGYEPKSRHMFTMI
jgi:hypothetical protein